MCRGWLPANCPSRVPAYTWLINSGLLAGAGIAFNPTSNLFLDSGLFQLHAAVPRRGAGGAGNRCGRWDSYSPLQSMNEAYKVVALGNSYSDRVPEERRETLTAPRAFCLAALGGARVVSLDDHIGSFRTGREADFVVLDWAATPC